jgi:hypothetical protein
MQADLSLQYLQRTIRQRQAEEKLASALRGTDRRLIIVQGPQLAGTTGLSGGG